MLSTQSPGGRRNLVPALIVVFCSVVAILPTPAGASPEDWFNAGYDSCVDSGFSAYGESQTFGCTICNVDVECSFVGTSSEYRCAWGAIKVDSTASDAQNEAAGRRGFNLYCVGSGGVMVSAASSAGVQNRGLATIFRSMEKRGRGTTSPREAGGVYEFTRVSVKDETAFSHGVAVPFNWPVRVASMDADLRGNLIFGYGEAIYQYGLNVTPSRVWRLYDPANPEMLRKTVGMTFPLQFVGTSGDGLSFGVSYVVGLGFLGGLSRSYGRYSVGGGAGLDLHYADGFQLPALFAGRVAYEYSSFSSLVFQPGLTIEVGAGGDMFDTVRPMMTAGVEFGAWLVGLQGFFQSGVITTGFGVSYQDQVAMAAAGTVRPAESTPQMQTQPYPPQYPGQPVYAPTPPQQQYAIQQPPPPAYPAIPPPVLPPQLPAQPPPPQTSTPAPPLPPAPKAPAPAAAAQPPRPAPAPSAPPPPAAPAAMPDFLAQQAPSWASPAPAPQPSPAAPKPQPPPPAPLPAAATPVHAPPPAAVPAAAPAASPQKPACINVAPCVRESATKGPPVGPCASVLYQSLVNACPGKIVCRVCSTTATGSVNPAACQTINLPPAGQPMPAASFCDADSAVVKCMAEGDPPACLD